ncbi:hypothetical protein DFH28DRAFT_904780 [Melampsora americana]|nr:hypothetical protein DFH28DRAFT_904780 [Melampsora americana]
MASSNDAMKLNSLQTLNNLKVMVGKIQDIHKSTEAIQQSIVDLESLCNLFISHEEKFSELLRSPIALQENIHNTGIVEKQLEDRLNSLTGLESQLASMKGNVAQLCDDVEVASSQIREQASSLNVLDSRLDAIDFKGDARNSAELATKAELQRLDSCNQQLKKSTHTELQRLDSCDQQLKNDQVRLNNELILIQQKVKNAHLNCSGELKKLEDVLHTQIESNRTVRFFASIHDAKF